MTNRFHRTWLLLSLCANAAIASTSTVAQTTNFSVYCAVPGKAAVIAHAAESFRRIIANHFFGKSLPNWKTRCPVTAHVHATLGAGGATKMVFNKGEVSFTSMEVQGSDATVVPAVLSHEVGHTVLAEHFRRPLPRWADEGLCTTLESEEERTKLHFILLEAIHNGETIPFSELMSVKEYPKAQLIFYAQGLSLTRFLLDRKGMAKFMEFLAEGLVEDSVASWDLALRNHYGYRSKEQLQSDWQDWFSENLPPEHADRLTAVAAPFSIGY